MNFLTRWIVKLVVGRLESVLGDKPGLSDNPAVIADTLDSYGVNVWAHVILADLGHALYSVVSGQETVVSALCHVIVLLAGLAIIWSRHAVSRNAGKLQSLVDQLAEKTTIKIDLGVERASSLLPAGKTNDQDGRSTGNGGNFPGGVMPLALIPLLSSLILGLGCAAPGSAHLSRQTVTGLHAEVPSTTGSGSLLKISFGRIQNTYIDIPTNSAPFSSTYQADASGKSPIFGNASTSTRDSVGYGESAVTTSTGGGLIVGSETGGVQRVVVPNLTK